MLGEPVSSNRVRIVWIGKAIFWIIRSAPVFHHRVDRCFRVEQIRDRWLYWLVERGHWTIGQSARSIEPASTFNVHRERIRARMCIQSITIWISFGSRWLRLREVWYIVANPAALFAIPIVVLGVPPEIFLAVRPRIAVRVSRGAVVDYMAIGRPGKAPVDADILVAMASPCQVLPLFRHYAAENPGTTGGTAIRFELRKAFDHLAISDGVTVDLFHDIFDDGFL